MIIHALYYVKRTLLLMHLELKLHKIIQVKNNTRKIVDISYYNASSPLQHNHFIAIGNASHTGLPFYNQKQHSSPKKHNLMACNDSSPKLSPFDSAVQNFPLQCLSFTLHGNIPLYHCHFMAQGNIFPSTITILQGHSTMQETISSQTVAILQCKEHHFLLYHCPVWCKAMFPLYHCHFTAQHQDSDPGNTISWHEATIPSQAMPF